MVREEPLDHRLRHPGVHAPRGVPRAGLISRQARACGDLAAEESTRARHRRVGNGYGAFDFWTWKPVDKSSWDHTRNIVRRWMRFRAAHRMNDYVDESSKSNP